VQRSAISSLNPKRPRIRGFKKTNSIDHIVKTMIQIGLNYILLESMKNIASVGEKINKIEQKIVPI